MRQKILQVTVRRAHKKQIRKSPLQFPGRIHLPRQDSKRILGRQVAIRGRIQRRPLNMRIEIRTSRRHIHQKNIQRLEQRQKLNRLREIRLCRVARVHAKSPAIRKQIPEGLRNSRTHFSAIFSVGGLRRIGMERHGVKRGNAHADFQLRRRRANSLHDFAQESRAILKTPSVPPSPSVRAKKFVPQISMAMFDVEKIKTKPPRGARRAMELFNDPANLSVGKQWKIARQTEPAIQNRMAIQNARLLPMLRIWFEVAPRMRKLQANQQSPIRTTASLMFLPDLTAQLRQPRARMLGNHQLIRIRPPAARNGDGFAAPN